MRPNQLMFCCKAQTPCDNWLGLNTYDLSKSVSKSSWIQEHHKLVQTTNQCALKNIQKSAEQSDLKTEGTELSIPGGKLVLLWDHLKSCNKIQDSFKDQKVVVVEQLWRPNVYQITPVNDVSLEWTVNCRQLQDLHKAHNGQYTLLQT